LGRKEGWEEGRKEGREWMDRCGWPLVDQLEKTEKTNGNWDGEKWTNRGKDRLKDLHTKPKAEMGGGIETSPLVSQDEISRKSMPGENCKKKRLEKRKSIKSC
jgi:hypothetical protein